MHRTRLGANYKQIREKSTQDIATIEYSRGSNVNTISDSTLTQTQGYNEIRADTDQEPQVDFTRAKLK